MRTERPVQTIDAQELASMTPFDISILSDWEKVKPLVKPRMVDTRETAYIEDKPHTYAADIPVIYYIEIGETEGNHMTAPVTERLFRNWNITIEELDKAARGNIDAVTMTLSGMIKELSGEDYEDCGAYVLTNRKRNFGAASVLDKGTLDKLSNAIGGALAIIPSSIHEVLVMRFDGEVEAYNAMIREVNASELMEDDILSNHLYIYEKESGLRAA